MRRRNFRSVNPRNPQISVHEHNDLLHTVQGLSRLSAGPRVFSSSSADGNNLSIPVREPWAKITFVGTGNPVPLSWKEQFENADGTTVDFPDQHFGYAAGDPANPNNATQPQGNWPAYDLTGATHKVGDIVRLIPAKGGEYYEVLAGGGGGSSTFFDDPPTMITFVSDVQCVGGTLSVAKLVRVVEGVLGFSVSLTNSTGGSFTLIANGSPTQPIAWNASAGNLLVVLPPGSLTTGGSFPGNVIQVYLPQKSDGTRTLTLGSNNLTGGTPGFPPTVVITGPS